MPQEKQFPTDLPDKIISVTDVDQDIGRWGNVNWIDVIETEDQGAFTQVMCMVVETADETKWRAIWDWSGGWTIGRLVRNEELVRQRRHRNRTNPIEKY